MRKIKLINTTGIQLYEGKHASLNEAIEYAITHHIKLDGIDLRGAILCNINLDGLALRDANFQGADLTGANMSEADFFNCDFTGADLTQACCCYSNFIHCHFNHCVFAATDISMASLDSCSFEGMSIFNLNFHSVFKMNGLSYLDSNQIYYFHAPPLMIRAYQRNILMIDNNVILNKLQNINSTYAIKFSDSPSYIEVVQSLIE